MILSLGGIARAQSTVWLQIEAQPSRAAAEERAHAYAAAFPDVAGFALTSGWYGIVLGPYAPDAAAAKLADLRRERLIPADSFVADGRNFRARFWPDADAPAPPPPTPDAGGTALAAPAPTPPPADETPAEARRAEAALTPQDRQAVQAALQWFGFYDASVDGAFGPGTRTAMAAWQLAEAAEPTGILTTAERAALVARHRAAMAELGLRRVSETEAGIEIDLPLAMVAFDHYEPPFVEYAPRDGSGVSVLLISQPGDQRTLYGLYDILQTLRIVPLEGERTRSDKSFEITGRNDKIESYSYAALDDGLVKGFTLVWPVADGARMARVLDAMKKSFRPVGDRALDPGLAPMNAVQRQGLLSGLEIRRPLRSRSGFFIDGVGTVLTTPDVLTACTRLTVEGDTEMELRLTDPALGLAILAPKRPLAPPATAVFQMSPGPVGAEVAVAGYPYEDRLTAPTLTFGHVAALEGLDGEAGVTRLALAAMPGDLGGPVIDATGTVIGMLRPADPARIRQFPADVAFAIPAGIIAARLAAAGVATTPAGPSAPLPPDDLARRALGMTVIVNCWN